MAWSTISKALDRSSATRMDLWAGLVLFSPSVMKVLISHSAVTAVERKSAKLGLVVNCQVVCNGFSITVTLITKLKKRI